MIKNQKGIALIVALILSLVSLVLIGMALYISTQGTKLSGRLKSYATALSAANGAYEIATTILPSIKQQSSFDLSNIDSLKSNNEKCLNIKLNNLTQNWTSTSGWSYNHCPSLNNATSSNIDDIRNYYDLQYKLGDYDVYIKVTSSSLGNTQQPSKNNLNVGSVVSNGQSGKSPPTMPHLYRIEILSEKNSSDEVHITALYAY